MPESEASLASIVETITSLGSTGALIVILYLFITGKLFTKTQMEATIQLMAKDLGEAIKHAVQEGIVLASAELQEDKDKRKR